MLAAGAVVDLSSPPQPTLEDQGRRGTCRGFLTVIASSDTPHFRASSAPEQDLISLYLC